MSTCKATKQYGIPKSTLMDQKNNRYETSNVGWKNDLTEESEWALKGYIDYMASINHPLSIPAVKAFAWAITKISTNPNIFNPETGPGNKWYKNFKARHNLTNRKLENVDRGRSRIGNTTVWKQHFDFLEETIDKLQLRDNPKAIFNCNESMIAMDRRSGTVVVSRKTKNMYSESKGTRAHITINACVSASGYIMPPHIILSQSYPSGPYARPMLEMDQIQHYTLYRIMAIWTANFFMVLFLNYSSPIVSKFQDLNYLFWMDMGCI